MTSFSRFLTAASVALLAFAAPQLSRADEFSGPQRGEIERIVREYLVAHPEVLQEAMTELEKRQSAAEVRKAQGRGQAIFASLVQLAAPGGARQSDRQRHLC